MGVALQGLRRKLRVLQRSNLCMGVFPSLRVHSGALGFCARVNYGHIRALSGLKG